MLDWPANPVDVIVKWLSRQPKEAVVADFGCGDAQIALQAPQVTIHSFDLVAVRPEVSASLTPVLLVVDESGR